MKVILLKDIPKVGKKNEVKDVNDGFARNSLLPRGLVQIATPSLLAQHEKRLAEIENTHKKELAHMKQRLDEISGAHISLTLPANDRGHLFAGLHKKEVSEEIKIKFGLAPPNTEVEFREPIKEVGAHNVTIKTEAGEARIVFDIEGE